MSFGKYILEITGLTMLSENSELKNLILMPVPQIMELTKGFLGFEKLKLATNLDEQYKFVITQLVDEITKHLGKKPQINESKLNISDSCTLFSEEIAKLSPQLLANFQEQGYIIDVDVPRLKISIWADAPAGIFYAIQTIFQILNHSPDKQAVIYGLKILDYPNMRLRGISDDVSRGQAPNMDGVKKFIVELSRFKMNYYFLYSEDIIKFSKHPEIGEGRGAFTAENIKELQAFAKHYFMEFTLIFQSLGHSDNYLSLPQYHQYAEFPSSDCLNISDPRIYDLLNDFYGELSSTFESRTLHLGCDESWELGKFRAKQYVESVGEGKAYLEHYVKIYDLAKKNGFKDIFLYHDIAYKYEEVLSEVPKRCKDLTFVYWDYTGRESYPKLEKIVSSGIPVVVSPAVQDWSRFFPNMTVMEDNTEKITRIGYSLGAFGCIQSSWGDFRNENLRDNRLYGFAYASALAWNIEKFTKTQFWDAFLMHFFETTPDNRLILDPLAFYRSCFDEKILKGWENYPRLWAHPFAYPKMHWAPKKGEIYRLKLPDLDKNVDISKNSIQTVKRNKLNAEMLHYAAKLYRYFVRKMLISEDYLKKEYTRNKSKFMEELKWLDSEILEMKHMFTRLWKTTCSDVNLQPLINQFEWMQKFYSETADEIASKPKGESMSKNPNIPSEWMYLCKKKKKSDLLQTFFLKELQIANKDELEYFKIQCIGDTHIKVHLNGQCISEFFSKRTLSVRMLNNLVQIIDLTPHLKNGSNILVIENNNYLGGVGIVNVYGIMKEKSGKTTELLSDSSWEATNNYDPNWIAGEYDLPKGQSEVELSESFGAPPLVNGSLSYPDFDKNLPSHHTSHLGQGGKNLMYVPLWLPKSLIQFAGRKAYEYGGVL